MKVYLCGGINGLTDDEAKTWREVAKVELARHGIDTLDPMRRDYRGREDDNVWDIVKGDIEDIKQSDIVLAMCERPSWGTGMEIKYAHEVHVPVVSVVGTGPVSPWLRFFTRTHKTLGEAIEDVVVFGKWLGERGR